MNGVQISPRDLLVSAAIVLSLTIVGCSKGETPVQPTPSTNLQPALSHAANNIILSVYVRLDSAAGELLTAVSTLQAGPSQSTLDAARQAWRATRVPWENSEAFLFGPVDTEGIDPSIDSWPVNEQDLNAVLQGSAVLTKEYLDGLEGTLKGFHTIEYLLFGTNGNKQIGDFTTREFEYLNAATQSLKGNTGHLKTAWAPSGGNFAQNLVNAGGSGSIYISQKAALQELVNGMLTIADEVGNGKINDPFAQMDVTLEESRFSNNSKADFQDNIRGILFLYAGTYSSSGSSISEVVRQFNTELDGRFQQSIQNAIDMIGAIPGTFTTAIFNNRLEVEAAQTAVRNVQQILEEEIVPLLNARIQ